MQSFEKLETETQYEYVLFEIYKNLPKNKRSLLNVLRKYNEERGLTTPTKIPKEVEEISKKNEWVKRSANYDEYIEDQLKSYNVEKQLEKIIDFKNRQQKLSKELTDISTLLLRKVSEKLVTLNIDDIPMNQLANFVKVAITVAQMSSNTESSILSINELVQSLAAKNNLTSNDNTNDNNFVYGDVDDDDEEWFN